MIQISSNASAGYLRQTAWRNSFPKPDDAPVIIAKEKPSLLVALQKVKELVASLPSKARHHEQEHSL